MGKILLLLSLILTFSCTHTATIKCSEFQHKTIIYGETATCQMVWCNVKGSQDGLATLWCEPDAIREAPDTFDQ